MTKSFTGAPTTAQVLSNPATKNPATVTSAGTITVNSTAFTRFAGLYGARRITSTASNRGIVQSPGGQGIGISPLTGGTPCR